MRAESAPMCRLAILGLRCGWPQPINPQSHRAPCPAGGGRMIISRPSSGLLAALPSTAPLASDQDRHLMTTTPGPRRRKAARLLSWFSTGRDGTRTDTHLERNSVDRMFNVVGPT